MAITDEADLVIRGTGAQSKTSLLVLGSLLVVVGALALWASFATTLLSILVVGVLLLVGAVFQGALAVHSKKAIEIASHAMLALLYVGAGLFMIMNPLIGAISITSLLGVFFLAGGIVRFGSAIYMRKPNWGWAAFSGVVTIILGAFTFYYLPAMSFVLIGTIVSIDLIFLGTTLIGYGAALPSELSSNEFVTS